VSRRAFLRRSTAAVLAVPLAGLLPAGAAAAAPAAAGVTVRPRADWAGGLAPTGPLQQEMPADVRFLLVHHTASANDYAPEDVPGLLRGFYAAHTGPGKNWPDVAYNFFVDRYGTAWEGRTGSLGAPVQADATGGSQGFAQLCCFVGTHTAEPPSAQARATMTALLAALADRYGIETAPGSTATFVSRGSNRWPAGTTVTTPTIAGHRDMSLTECPGEAAYALVRDAFPAEVTALRTAASPPTSPPTTSPPTTSPPMTSPPTSAPTPATGPGSAPPTGAPARPTGSPTAPEENPGWTAGDTALAATAITVGTAAGYVVRGQLRRSRAAQVEDAGERPGLR
jgi:hypothetical protein